MLLTSGLTYSYNNLQTLTFPDLKVNKGNHTLIIGKSGCGKTTLLHLLSGLRSPSSGTISILDNKLTSMSPSDTDRFRGKHIGMIFQVPHFLKSLSVLDNLKIAQKLAGMKVDVDKCRSMLNQLNIGQKENEKTGQLSVGEQQRVAIIRALINEPDIIFADEPTSALDDDNTEQVIELLKSQAGLHGATLIVVTHDQRLKDNFDQMISL